MTSRAIDDVKLLALDLDGTLVDSAPDLSHCLGIGLVSVGLDPPTEAQTLSWIGDGVEALLERALTHALPHGVGRETFAAAFASFTSCYEKNLFTRSRLYPEVPGTLDVLRSRGMRLCCITNKRVGFADGVLERARIRDRFEIVLGGDSLAEKKPSPAQLDAAAAMTGIAPAAAVMVGDSYHDFHAAKAAGYAFVWATYGYCKAIDASPADRVIEISSFAELGAFLTHQ